MESLKRRFIYTESPSIVDIYYGTGTTTGVTSFDITTKFSTATGNIGSLTGRQYTFGPAFLTYRFWAIPDLPNTGERVIDHVTKANGVDIIVMQPAQTSFYSYFQENPSPALELIKYGKLDINGVTYRLYRTSSQYSSSNSILKVFSIS